MKSVKYSIIIYIITFFYSCSFFEDDKEKFTETYREILIIREMYRDTARVSKEIGELFEKNGYDWQSFNEEYNQFKENPEVIMEIMDSVRERNQRELIKFRKN
jgi:hypothetical protein